MLGGFGKGFTTGRSRQGLLTRGCGKVVLRRGLAYGRDLCLLGKFRFVEIVQSQFQGKGRESIRNGYLLEEDFQAALS